MRVSYRVRVDGRASEDEGDEQYDIVETRTCCRACATAWERDTFSLEAAVDAETNEPVPAVCIVAFERADDGEFESLVPINYCPFCGTGILCRASDD